MPDQEITSSHRVGPFGYVRSKLSLGPKQGGGTYADLKIAYADSFIDRPATWEISLIQPMTNNARGSKLTLKRYQSLERRYFRLPGVEQIEMGSRLTFNPDDTEIRMHHAKAKNA